MREGFIEWFIQEEKYLQNPLMKHKDFIKFCEERGIKTNESELEFFEEKKIFYPILRSENPIEKDELSKFLNREASYMYPQFNDDEHHRNRLLYLMDEGYLFDPSTRPFEKWSSFKGEELENGSEKFSSFYSSFQIHWLILLKESYSFNINLANDKIIVSSSLPRFNRSISDNFTIGSFDDFQIELEKEASEDIFGELVFNFEKKKQELIKMREYYEKFLEFLLSIQSVYTPYSRSSSKSITVKGNDEKWWENRINFNPKEELEKLNLDIEFVVRWYVYFSKKVQDTFGKSYDWIQLLKNINWDKKKKLEGNLGLEIEYLKWSLMLKRFIQDYYEKNIQDIDEISKPEEILDNIENPRSLKNRRKKLLYFDEKNDKSHYHNTYKRLFYLANDFDLDYHPRLIVFVEGKTELQTLPKFFEVRGSKPENLGIDFINIEGITKFYGREFKVKENERRNSIILNNFLNLINYTLNKWQTVPFFIGDNENNIKKLLNKGICLEFDYDSERKTLPEKWYHIWDKDFELDNFTDEELAIAIKKVLNSSIENKDVAKIRNNEKGIKNLDTRINETGVKIKIANVLYENLLEEYKITENENLFKRPIFDLIKKLKIMALRNYPPAHTSIESINKKYILDVLEGKESK